MKAALIDTDILSLFLRGDSNVVQHIKSYLALYDKLNLSIITYYEIISGLKHRDAHKQLDRFLEFTQYNTVLPLTQTACTLAANIYAQLRRQGKPIDDIDLLIAGIALEHNLVLATHNVGHFDRIEGLAIEDWCQTAP